MVSRLGRLSDWMSKPLGFLAPASGRPAPVVAPATAPPPRRHDQLLAGIDPETMVGLEIGPLDKPLVARTGGRRIYYLDFNTTAELRTRFAGDPNVSVAAICEVDYPTGGRPIGEIVDRTFDYIVASHVFEHIPNPVRWLQDLTALLNPGGVIALAIPDRRYTFDILRPATSIGSVLEAYYTARTRPAFASVFDQHFHWRWVEASAIWEGRQDPRASSAPSPPESALQLACTTLADPAKYEDVHCTVITDREFVELFTELARFGLTELKIKHLVETAPGELDFFVQLAR